jgi:xanthine dehydrogenase molybdopterin-binding subunit B
MIIESIIQHVAVELSKPPHVIAQLNIYTEENCVTPKGEKLDDWRMPADWANLKEKNSIRGKIIRD